MGGGGGGGVGVGWVTLPKSSIVRALISDGYQIVIFREISTLSFLFFVLP